MLFVISVAFSTMPSRCSTNLNELPLKIIHGVVVDRRCQPEKQTYHLGWPYVSNGHEVELAGGITTGKPHKTISWSQWRVLCPIPRDYILGKQ
ncbi:rCG32737 [Rattus norvegicus]|uniref:RCG32737 n=1 Tax=Rattus norvegicus TaxID=10116 RepID=A6HFG3_RAT|nr:rCG32737 [Rattus norvegicus]